MKAFEILDKVAGLMKEDRVATYDKRFMEATVAAFYAITGIDLSEEQGWLFMLLFEAVQSQQGIHRAENYEELVVLISLMGEAAFEDRGNPESHTLMEYDETIMDTIDQNDDDEVTHEWEFEGCKREIVEVYADKESNFYHAEDESGIPTIMCNTEAPVGTYERQENGRFLGIDLIS